jgi:hypothetical protein
MLRSTCREERQPLQDNSKLRAYTRQYQNKISELLKNWLRELLSLLKANDCMRSIDGVLGRLLNTIALACPRSAVDANSIAAGRGAQKRRKDGTEEDPTDSVFRPGRYAANPLWDV